MFFLPLFHMYMIHLIGLVKKAREMEVPALVADTNIFSQVTSTVATGSNSPNLI